MDKKTRLKLVLTILKVFGWGWLLVVGLPLGLYMEFANPYTARGLGQILGTIFILSPGFAALYWAKWEP